MRVFCLRCGLVIWLSSLLAWDILAVGQEHGIAEFPHLSADLDWPWWHSPSRDGIASAAPVPVRFSESSGVVWKAPVPGRGHSSPIVVRDRVFLSTADEKRQIQSVLAYDRQTGKEVWQTEISRGGFPTRNQSEKHRSHTDHRVRWRASVRHFLPSRADPNYCPGPERKNSVAEDRGPIRSPAVRIRLRALTTDLSRLGHYRR